MGRHSSVPPSQWTFPRLSNCRIAGGGFLVELKLGIGLGKVLPQLDGTMTKLLTRFGLSRAFREEACGGAAA
jgi:hypothetical protein